MKYDHCLYLRYSQPQVTAFSTMLSTKKCGELHSEIMFETIANKRIQSHKKKRPLQRSDRSKHKKTN